MTAILSITFPIFAVIGLGYGFLRGRLFRSDDLRALSLFVMNIALPALLFNAVTGAGSGALNPVYMGCFAAGSLLTLTTAHAWFRLTGVAAPRVAVATLGTCMSNSGYVGYPILLLAWPPLAAPVLAMNVIVENFLILPVCLILFALADASGGGPWRAALKAVAATLRRPMMLGLLAGLALRIAGVEVPAAVSRLTSLLGSATAPIALFYIGGTLAALTLTGNRSVAAQIVAGKLLLHPALVVLVVVLAPVLGLPALDPALRGPVVVVSALPMLGIYAILAAEKGHAGMASIALLGATLVSFFTLSGLLALLL